MTLEEMEAAFEQYNDEYIKFERIENPRHPRPDVCAFLMLHDLAPGDGDMVAGGHEKIWLHVDAEVVAQNITHEQIRDLARCGVMFHEDESGFWMFT